MDKRVSKSAEVVVRAPMPLTLPSIEAIEPTHFDGWSVDDLDQWLTGVAPTFGMIRRGIGLALWHLRRQVSDGDYGRAVERMAELAGVTPTTVGRWRSDAEAYFQLAAPSKRTDARRQRIPLTTNRRELESESEAPELRRPLPKPPQVKVNNGCGHVAARRDGADCLDCGATVGHLAVPAEAPGETVEKCIRCQNCPRCGGTGVLAQRERKPFGR